MYSIAIHFDTLYSRVVLNSAIRPRSVVGMGIQAINVIMLPDGRMDRKNAARYLGLSVKTLAMHVSRGTGPKFIKRGRVFVGAARLRHHVPEAWQCLLIKDAEDAKFWCAAMSGFVNAPRDIRAAPSIWPAFCAAAATTSSICGLRGSGRSSCSVTARRLLR